MKDFRKVIEDSNDTVQLIRSLSASLNPIIFVKHEAPVAKDYCGKTFEKGDIVYSCKDCGLDSTCVMCVECFKNTQHKDHDVSYHFSQGSGGCCDCGDLEAWKIPLSCKIHTI